MIANVQLLRGLAALAVAFHHTRFTIHGAHTEFHAVPLFFVISGFIMSHISQDEARNFFVRRLIRIVPLYWLATLCFALLDHSGMLDRPGTAAAIAAGLHRSPQIPAWWSPQLAGIDVVALIKSLLFIPYLNANGDVQPVLGQGWTLNLEMFYYLVFAASIGLGGRLAPLLTTLTLAVIMMLAAVSGCTAVACSFYGHAYGTYFLLGILCFYLWRALPRPLPRSAAWFIVPASIAIFTIFIAWSVSPSTLAEVQAAATFGSTMPTLVVFCSLLMHNVGLRCEFRVPMLLGAASYAVYLTHTFVTEAMFAASNKLAALDPSQNMTAMAVAIGSSVALAILIHKTVEISVTSRLRTLALLRTRMRPASA